MKEDMISQSQERGYLYRPGRHEKNKKGTLKTATHTQADNLDEMDQFKKPRTCKTHSR